MLKPLCILTTSVDYPGYTTSLLLILVVKGKAFSLLSCLCIYRWFDPWSPHMETKERPKKEAGHSKLVGGCFNKQENLCRRLVLCGL